MVLGLIERGGKVRTFVVPDRGKETLTGIMRENVETNSRIISDALPSYRNLNADYAHVSVKHTYGNYVTYGDEHTNNIEGYWSILKRGIIGTFHSVSPQHLQRYCNEFAHRYNTKGLEPILEQGNDKSKEVIIHIDHADKLLKIGATDPEVIIEAGKTNAIIISQDDDFKRIKSNLALIKQLKVGYVLYRPPKRGSRYWEIVEAFIGGWKTLKDKLTNDTPPFVYQIEKDGKIQKVPL
jgi:ISXO2-like transposase domain